MDGKIIQWGSADSHNSFNKSYNILLNYAYGGYAHYDWNVSGDYNSDNFCYMIGADAGGFTIHAKTYAKGVYWVMIGR